MSTAFDEGDLFDDPGATVALDLDELLGRLLLIKPKHVEREVNTVLGAKDATVVDLTVLDGKASWAHRPGLLHLAAGVSGSAALDCRHRPVLPGPPRQGCGQAGPVRAVEAGRPDRRRPRDRPGMAGHGHGCVSTT